MEQTDNRLYSRPVLDLITVGAEYCKNLERVREADKAGFLTVMRGLLPMIYLKVSLLGEIPEEAGWNLPRVTEEDYEYVRTGIADTLGEDDSFLDVFVEDFKFSEAPVLCTVSECLADVYQQLRELVATFKEEEEEAMGVALSETVAEFRLQWGQKLLNALRAIHDISYHAL